MPTTFLVLGVFMPLDVHIYQMHFLSQNTGVWGSVWPGIPSRVQTAYKRSYDLTLLMYSRYSTMESKNSTLFQNSIEQS